MSLVIQKWFDEDLNAASSGVLAGVSAMVFGAGSSTLTGAGALAGTAAEVFGAGSSTLTGSGALAGAAAMIFGAGSSTVTGAGALAGSAALIFGPGASDLKGAGALAGASALVFGASATVDLNGAISGSADITFGGSAALSGSGALAGAAAMIFDAAGTPDGTGAIVTPDGAVWPLPKHGKSRKVRRAEKQRTSEDYERERKMIEQYLESLEKKAPPRATGVPRAQSAPAQVKPAAVPRLTAAMARAAHSHELELIEKHEAARQADRERAEKERHQRRRAAVAAVLMLSF